MNPQFKNWIVDNLKEKDWLNRSEDERSALYKTAVAKGYTGSFESFSRKIRRVKNELNGANVPEPDKNFNAQGSVNLEVEGNEGVVTSEASSSIRTIDDLLKSAKVDMSIWNLQSQKVNTWEAQSAGGNIVSLYQVKGYLVKKIPDVQKIPVIQPILLHPENMKFKKQEVNSGKPRKTLIFGDAQIGFNRKGDFWEPYHSREAMDIILKIVADHKFDEIIINGDMLDCTEASKYQQKPEFAGTFQPSINELGLYLEKMRSLSTTSKMVFIAGNHSHRIENAIIENFKFAYGLTAYKQEIPVMSIPNLLQLPSLGIEYIGDYPKGSYWVGDGLRIIHGEFTSLTKELNTSNTNVIMGHLHRIQTESKTVSYRDGVRQISVHTHGALCKNDGTVPGVSARPSWQQGAMVVNSYGDYYEFNHIYINGKKCVYQGKLYEGEDTNPGKVY